MSIDRPHPRDRWAALRNGGHEASGLEIPTLTTDVETGFGPVRTALGPKGEPRLLLPLKQTERTPKLPSTPTLNVRDATFGRGNRQLRFLDIMCTAPELEVVFSEVAVEMLDRVRKGASCVDACRSTLNDFRALLVASAQMRVPAHVIYGLVGELLFLERLLLRDQDAWRLWRGPLRERHDFRGGKDAIEVKATGRFSDNRVKISAVDQLLSPEGGSLHLQHFVLEPVEAGILTVDSLTASALANASDPMEVRNLLAELECADPSAPEWNRLSFRLEREALYEIREGFPRIVPSSFRNDTMPPGIVALEYDVDLSTAEDYRLDGPSASQNIEDRMLACLYQN